MKARVQLAQVALLTVVAALPAHAYGDPGSGALLLQMLLAAAFGALFYVRKMWDWVRGKDRNRPARPETDENG